MSFSAVIDALAIPSDARIDQRVPKKLLAEQGAPTAADKRQIQDGIEEVMWVAALKPTNVGVPAFRDDQREYLEISVLTATLRQAAKAARIVELIHRAIPYPVFLITARRGTLTVSGAHKRWSQGEAGKVVIADVREVSLNSDERLPEEQSFLASLPISTLPSKDMFTLYDGLLERMAALEAARITGSFDAPDSVERASVVREGLDLHAKLTKEIDTLRKRAAREKQMNRRVELNTEIKRLEAELAVTQKEL